MCKSGRLTPCFISLDTYIVTCIRSPAKQTDVSTFNLASSNNPVPLRRKEVPDLPGQSRCLAKNQFIERQRYEPSRPFVVPEDSSISRVFQPEECQVDSLCGFTKNSLHPPFFEEAAFPCERTPTWSPARSLQDVAHF